MTFKPYLDQLSEWPKSGKHILAQFDEDSVCVYQAYRPAIAIFAVEHQKLGGEFSFSRMSWIKPNFLWMMYRSGWAAKPEQEHILAVRLRRTFFDELLCSVVPSSFDPHLFSTREKWQEAVKSSEVRLQWDPDHDAVGKPIERRAVQLGLRGSMLRRYAERELISIEDITPFVIAQRQHLTRGLHELQTPTEQVYQPRNDEAARKVGLAEPS